MNIRIVYVCGTKEEDRPHTVQTTVAQSYKGN